MFLYGLQDVKYRLGKEEVPVNTITNITLESSKEGERQYISFINSSKHNHKETSITWLFFTMYNIFNERKQKLNSLFQVIENVRLNKTTQASLDDLIVFPLPSTQTARHPPITANIQLYRTRILFCVPRYECMQSPV